MFVSCGAKASSPARGCTSHVLPAENARAGNDLGRKMGTAWQYYHKSVTKTAKGAWMRRLTLRQIVSRNPRQISRKRYSGTSTVVHEQSSRTGSFSTDARSGRTLSNGLGHLTELHDHSEGLGGLPQGSLGEIWSGLLSQLHDARHVNVLPNLLYLERLFVSYLASSVACSATS